MYACCGGKREQKSFIIYMLPVNSCGIVLPYVAQHQPIDLFLGDGSASSIWKHLGRKRYCIMQNEERVFEEKQHRDMSRREFLVETGRTLSMALASAGVFYEFIDQLAQKPEQVAFAATQPLPPEQYIIPSTRIVNVTSAGVSGSGPGTIPVLLHPLHNHIITAKVNVPANAKALQEAQHHLESVLGGLEQHFSPATSNGVAIQVAWGLASFQHSLPILGKSSRFFKAGKRYQDLCPVDLLAAST